MKNSILFTACLFAATQAEASPLSLIFGKEQPAVGTPLQVEGPLLQMKTEGGTTLSFQHGTAFEVKDDGAVDLKKGNLRVGPSGGDTLKLALPSGEAEIEPLSAVTVTVDKGKASGRVYQGSMSVMGRTFMSGEGFEVTSKGAQATFTPQPAQAPALNGKPMPTDDSKAVLAVTDKTELKRWVPGYSLTGSKQTPPVEVPQPQDPQEEPEVQPEPEVPVTTPVEPEVPVTTPEPETEVPPIEEPEVPVVPPAEEPETSVPSDDVLKTFGEASIAFVGTDVNAGLAQGAGTMNLGAYVAEDGTVKLNSVESSIAGVEPIRLFKGTAELADAHQIGEIAGLGRWVGGNLVAVNGGQATMIANHSVYGEGEDAVTLPNSVHFIWGERATQIPTSGRIEYALHSATQPTYAVRDGSTILDGTGMVFDGTLAIDFAQGFSGQVGKYHLNGTVTAPGENQVYTMSTAAGGVGLKNGSLSNIGTLNVTSGVDAVACPTGQCSGSVNVLGFGAGMAQAGAAYSINSTGSVGIDGAALFVAKP